MPTGKVKWFKDDKGYGFIVPDGASDDEDNVFVHKNTLRKSGVPTLLPGDRVEFEIGEGKDGRDAAKSVRKLARAA